MPFQIGDRVKVKNNAIKWITNFHGKEFTVIDRYYDGDFVILLQSFGWGQNNITFRIDNDLAIRDLILIKEADELIKRDISKFKIF